MILNPAVEPGKFNPISDSSKELRKSTIKTYFNDLRPAEVSWSWIAQNIAVLRTVFDRLCGLAVTEGLVTPKRGFRLPEILSENEAERIVQAGANIRDQLLLGLLYGCGLTGHEACRLRWRDVLHNGRELHVAQSTRYMERLLSVPEPLRELLQLGARTCQPDDYIFRGRKEGSHLSHRMVEILVRNASRRAGIERPVCVMTLRHSYAVRRIENGIGLRQLQRELGHASIRTTERYEACLAPQLETHPFSEVRRRMAAELKSAGKELPAPPKHMVGGRRTPQTAPPLSNLKTVQLRKLRLPFDRPDGISPAKAFFNLVKSRLINGFCRKSPVRSP